MLRGRDSTTHQHGTIVAAVDIGTSKVCCLIAALAPAGQDSQPGHDRQRHQSDGNSRLVALGLGHQRSRGIEAGALIDARAALPCVRAAISQAEQLARIELSAVHLAISCGAPRSRTFHGRIPLPAGVVEQRDIAALDHGARAYPHHDGGTLLALTRLGYRLDGTTAVPEPLGMAAASLHADHHAVLADDGPVRNLMVLIENCHLAVTAAVPTAYASALSATTPQERARGVTCIDIGAGLTSIAAFSGGHHIFTATLPAGGQQITSDIAAALSVPLAEAERIKTLYATLAPGASETSAYAAFPFATEAGVGLEAPARLQVARIVRQHMTALLERSLDQVERGGVSRWAGGRLVLTGGASQVLGLAGFASSVLRRDVRVAGPAAVHGWAAGMPGPAFTCLIGLVEAASAPQAWLTGSPGEAPETTGYLGRMERWLRESF